LEDDQPVYNHLFQQGNCYRSASAHARWGLFVFSVYQAAVRGIRRRQEPKSFAPCYRAEWV